MLESFLIKLQADAARVSFLIKLQAEACNFIKKETLAQVFSCELCETSKNTFFIEHLRWILLFLEKSYLNSDLLIMTYIMFIFCLCLCFYSYSPRIFGES